MVLFGHEVHWFWSLGGFVVGSICGLVCGMLLKPSAGGETGKVHGKMACGHGREWLRQDGEGTAYCVACEIGASVGDGLRAARGPGVEHAYITEIDGTPTGDY